MKESIIRNLWGQNLMVFGAAFFKYASNLVDLSPFFGSLCRVLVNLLVSIFIYLLIRNKMKERLLGDDKKSLFIWGLLGSLTVTFFFQSLSYLGVGIASFLLTTSGALMVFLSPLVSKRAPSLLHILSAFLCVLGALFLSPPSLEVGSYKGVVFGLLAAFSAAGAYLIVGDRMDKESPVTLMFYWSLIGTAFHLLQVPFTKVSLDLGEKIWFLVLLASLFASVGQYWVNKSYQCKGNWIIGLVSYLACITGLFIDTLILDIELAPSQYVGILIILSANIVLALPSRLRLRRVLASK